jgi:hypothetical protein
VVLTFIAATVGLLAWAGIRKVLEKRMGDGVRIGDTSQGYTSVGER